MAVGANGTNVWRRVAENPGYRGVTMCLWLKRVSDTNDYMATGPIIDETVSSPGGSEEQIGFGNPDPGNGDDVCGFCADNDSWPETPGYDISDGDWHFAAIVWESDGTFTLYAGPIGGSLTSIGSDTESTTFTPAGVVLGPVGGDTDMIYAGVRIWQAELTFTELEAEMASGTMEAIRTTNLWAEWLLPDNTDFTDTSGNGRDLGGGTGSFTSETDPPLITATTLDAFQLYDNDGSESASTPHGDQSEPAILGLVCYGSDYNGAVSDADASLAWTSDFYFTAYIKATDYRPASALAICQVRDDAGGDAWCGLHMNEAGQLFVALTEDNVDVAYLYADTALPDTTEPIQIRADVDVDNGASGISVTFYTKGSGLDAAWTQLGSTITNSTYGAMSVFNGISTAVARVGYRADGFGWDGIIYWVGFTDNTGGGETLVAIPDFSLASQGWERSDTTGDTGTDDQGIGWTINGDARILGGMEIGQEFIIRGLVDATGNPDTSQAGFYYKRSDEPDSEIRLIP